MSTSTSSTKKSKSAAAGAAAAAAASPAPSSGGGASTTNLLLESLDITPHPKTFKNPHYKPPSRRNKNLKQMLSDGNNANAANANGGGTTTTSTAVQATYQNIESAPSFRRGNTKWCDVTGLPAKYTDPKTKLRYHDGEVYRALRGLPAGGAERYLEVRGANVVLK